MKRIITILSMLLFFLASCRKEDTSVFVPDPDYRLDSGWVNSISDQSKICELVKNILPPAPLTDSAELFLNDTTFIRREFYDIIIPPGTLKGSSSGDITGKIAYNFFFTDKLGDYIRLQQSTINNEQYLLSTDGSFYTRFFRGTEELTIAAGKNIIVRYNDPQPKSAMKVFYGSDVINYPVPVNVSNGWLTSSGSCYVKPVARKFNNNTFYAYEVSTDKLKWINTASGLPANNTLLNLNVYLPDLFSNANTEAYLIIKDFKTAVKLSGDVNSRKFTAPNIPSGKSALIVTISKIATEYFLGTQDIITSDKPVEVKPVKGGFDRITSYINSL